MPIYEYEAADTAQACDTCRKGFERIQTLSEPNVQFCPCCGRPVRKIISAPASLRSHGDFDGRAKNAGFHKLQRVDKGVYEKKY